MWIIWYVKGVKERFHASMQRLGIRNYELQVSRFDPVLLVADISWTAASFDVFNLCRQYFAQTINSNIEWFATDFERRSYRRRRCSSCAFEVRFRTMVFGNNWWHFWSWNKKLQQQKMWWQMTEMMWQMQCWKNKVR